MPVRHREVLREFREMVGAGGLQARQPEVLASLYVAMESFLKFAHLTINKGPLVREWPWEQVTALLAVTKNGLLEVATTQTQVSRATSPLAKFVRLLISGLSAGRAELVDQKDALSGKRPCAGLGWVNATHVLLLPDEVHRFVAEALRETGDTSILPLRDYFQMMVAELGATQPTPSERGRIGVKRKCADRQERVIEIPLKSFGDDAELLRPLTNTERIARQLREAEQSAPVLGVGFDVIEHEDRPN